MTKYDERVNQIMAETKTINPKERMIYIEALMHAYEQETGIQGTDLSFYYEVWAKFYGFKPKYALG